MVARIARPPSPILLLWAGAAATVVGIASSLLIARSRDTAANGSDSDQTESAGQVSDAESLQGGPAPIYPDQAVAGYPDSESGGPDEGPAGPNSRPDWDGPGTGA